jgi:cytochrome c oxidase subunit 4
MSPKLYLAVYAALLLLTGTTVLLSMQELGAWEIPVALGIATGKTVLVVLFFMHMMHSPKLVWLIAAAGVVFLGIMMLGTLADYATRSWLPPWPQSP